MHDTCFVYFARVGVVVVCWFHQELNEDDNDGEGQQNMWNRFVNGAVETTSNAIAAATMKKVKEDIGLPTSSSSSAKKKSNTASTSSIASKKSSSGGKGGNPFVALPSPSGNAAPAELDFDIDDDENPFASSNPHNTGIPAVTGGMDDAEGNPFVNPSPPSKPVDDEDNPFAQ
jgi:hypothetical protein